jgi:hypothetical protein
MPRHSEGAADPEDRAPPKSAQAWGRRDAISQAQSTAPEPHTQSSIPCRPREAPGKYGAVPLSGRSRHKIIRASPGEPPSKSPSPPTIRPAARPCVWRMNCRPKRGRDAIPAPTNAADSRDRRSVAGRQRGRRIGAGCRSTRTYERGSAKMSRIARRSYPARTGRARCSQGSKQARDLSPERASKCRADRWSSTDGLRANREARSISLQI